MSALKGRRAQLAKIDEEVRQSLNAARKRRAPEPLRFLSAPFERDAQAHADYWREAYAAVQDKHTGIITLVTRVRAPYVFDSVVLRVYTPADVPADQWPDNPMCHDGIPECMETVPGFRLNSEARRHPTAYDRSKFDRPSDSGLTSSQAKMIPVGGPRSVMSRMG